MTRQIIHAPRRSCTVKARIMQTEGEMPGKEGPMVRRGIWQHRQRDRGSLFVRRIHHKITCITGKPGGAEELKKSEAGKTLAYFIWWGQKRNGGYFVP